MASHRRKQEAGESVSEVATEQNDSAPAADQGISIAAVDETR
jgi:hypothetical protein